MFHQKLIRPKDGSHLLIPNICFFDNSLPNRTLHSIFAAPLHLLNFVTRRIQDFLQGLRSFFSQCGDLITQPARWVPTPRSMSQLLGGHTFTTKNSSGKLIATCFFVEFWSPAFARKKLQLAKSRENHRCFPK